MALTKEKKEQTIKQVNQLLEQSKMTVIVKFQGTPVKAMQDLRKQGAENGTKFKVIKNRLFKQAIKNNQSFKEVPSDILKEMLLYAFNAEDEVAPAQTIANFAKKQPNIEFIGAISDEGVFLDAEKVKSLSALPSKNELIAEVVSILNAPLDNIMKAASGNLNQILDSLAANAK